MTTQTLLFLSADQTKLFSTDGQIVTSLLDFTTNGFEEDPIYGSIGEMTVGSTLYLTMNDATGATSAIWSYDGGSLTQITSSANYVYNQQDFNSASNSTPMGSYNGDLAFSQASLASNSAGDQNFDTATLAICNPLTGAITQPSTPNGGYDPKDFVTLNGVLYFEAEDSATGSEAIYSYNGTSVVEIYNLAPTYLNTVYNAMEPAAGTVQGPLVVFNGNLYFGSGQQTVYELNATTSLSNSATNAAPAAEYPFATLGATDLIVSNNHLFFCTGNNGIFSLDTNNVLTQVLGSIGAQSFTPISYNGQLYFIGYDIDPNNNSQLIPNLYTTTGGAGTIVIPDISLSDFAVLGNTVYDSSSQIGLATFDGAAIGTLNVPGYVGGAPLATAPFAAEDFGVSIATYLASEAAFSQRGLRVSINDTTANFTASAAAMNAAIAQGKVAALTRTNITGQAYSATAVDYNTAGNKTSVEYENLTGQPYQSLEYLLSGTQAGGYSDIGFQYGYVNQASHLSEVDYDGGGRLLRVLYAYDTSVAGALAYLELDYVAGKAADSLYTQNGPGGTSFSTAVYEFDDGNQYVGATYISILSGQTYDEVQASFTAGTAPTLTEVTYSQYTDFGGPDAVSYFYNAGTFAATQEVFTGVTGQTYTSVTEVLNSSGTIVASQYAGYTTKPFDTLTYFDNASGAPRGIVRNFDNVVGTIGGNTYYSYETIDNPSNVLLATAYRLDTGGNVYVGVASGVIAPTFGGVSNGANAEEVSYALSGGDWTITGGGTNESFSFASLFNTAEITDYGASVTAAAPDKITLAASDFSGLPTFIADGAASGPDGANSTFTSTTTGDKLTLDGVTLAQVANLGADFKFV
jgi:hypothetical protein